MCPKFTSQYLVGISQRSKSPVPTQVVCCGLWNIAPMSEIRCIMLHRCILNELILN